MVPELHVAVQIEPESPDSLRRCGWSPRPAHGWRFAGPRRTPPKKEEQLWSDASLEQQYHLQFILGRSKLCFSLTVTPYSAGSGF